MNASTTPSTRCNADPAERDWRHLGQPVRPLAAGVTGAVLLLLGSFAPVAKGPVAGTVSFTGLSHGQRPFLLFAAVLSVLHLRTWRRDNFGLALVVVAFLVWKAVSITRLSGAVEAGWGWERPCCSCPAGHGNERRSTRWPDRAHTGPTGDCGTPRQGSAGRAPAPTRAARSDGRYATAAGSLQRGRPGHTGRCCRASARTRYPESARPARPARGSENDQRLAEDQLLDHRVEQQALQE